MKSSAFYFSHDYNAQNDEKIIKLMSEKDWFGYGLYWGIIEKLYENSGQLTKDYVSLAFALRTKADVLREVIENYGLFVVEKDVFYSNSVLQRLANRNEKRELLAESGRKGGLNSAFLRNQLKPGLKKIEASLEPGLDEIEARKGKERKGNILIASPDATNESQTEVKGKTTLQDLYSSLGLPPKTRASTKWQEEATAAVKLLQTPNDKASSIYKCYRDNLAASRTALIDCKELGKYETLYFLKVYNELLKKRL